MSTNGLRVAQACPVRNVVISDSFRIQAVDAFAEMTVGHEFRQSRREELGISDDRSILHPDQPKLALRGLAPSVPIPVGRQIQQPIQPPSQQDPIPVADPKPNGAEPGALGLGLEKLVGKFEGSGFNTILRPQNGPAGVGKSDNLLELNFTQETLTFLDWKVLGDVPNRGFGLQEDLNLRGIPYTQEVKDLANKTNGKADLPFDKAPGIHFEQGLLMRTPALTPFANTTFEKKGPTILPPTITRMASIPHGTTINAQCEEPSTKTNGAPVFRDLNATIILPFEFGATDPIKSALKVQSQIISFPQQDFDKVVSKDRIPTNFEDFKNAKTINKAQFNNPNNYLKNNNDNLKIIEHVTFEVDTKPKKSLWGGGSTNIAQLGEQEEDILDGQGNATGLTATHVAATANRSTANANAVRVTCRYWISTVEDVITIPAYDKASLPRFNSDPTLKDKPENIVWKVVSPAAVPGVKKPSFQITLDKNPTEFKAKVRYTQIQYSQNVTLDFGRLSWPHISVATLVPAAPIPISKESMFQKVA